MNAKKAKAIRKALRMQGVDPRDGQWLTLTKPATGHVTVWKKLPPSKQVSQKTFRARRSGLQWREFLYEQRLPLSRVTGGRADYLRAKRESAESGYAYVSSLKDMHREAKAMRACD